MACIKITFYTLVSVPTPFDNNIYALENIFYRIIIFLGALNELIVPIHVKIKEKKITIVRHMKENNSANMHRIFLNMP